MSTANVSPRIACPHCQASIKSPSLPAGAAVNCPKCGQRFVLGGEARAETTSAPAKSATPPPAPSAAALTQPAHQPAAVGAAGAAPRPPDHLVDPNLLAPPKPKPKPAAQEVALTCKLCGSRLYAPLSKIGQTVRCHDCHTENEVKAPVDPATKKKTAASANVPTLDNVEEFGLSEVTERPAYRPLVVPRGDDAILSELDPATHAAGFSPPATGDKVAFAPKAHEVDEELTLSAPVERLEIKPALPPIPTVIAEDPEAKLRDGRYNDDDLIGAGGINRKAPHAWKKAPFLIGLVEFLFQPETLSRWIMYALGGGGLLVLAHTAVALTFSDGAMQQLLAIFADGAGGLVSGFFMFLLSAVLLAIVEDTANGLDEIGSWPDWNIGDWFFNGLQVLAAAFVSGLAGMAASTFLVTGGITPLVVPLVMVTCWTALFPIVMYSMLIENSITSIYSQRTGQSLQRAPEAWMLFYLYSVGLGIFGGGFAVLAMLPYVVAMLIGGAGLVTMAFVYFRLLGRLMWYCEEKATRQPSEHPPLT